MWLALCYAPLPAAAKRGAVLALAVGYLVLLFLVQRDFLRGMDAFANAVKLCLNTRFNADFAVGEAGACGLFVLLALVPITAFFAAVTVWRSDALLLDLVLLPAVVLVLLAGAGGGAVGWLLLLLGCVGAWAAAPVGAAQAAVGQKRFHRLHCECGKLPHDPENHRCPG